MNNENTIEAEELGIAEKPMSKLFCIPLILFPFWYILYQHYQTAHPYYFAWDSTQIYALDLLLVGSGSLPDHFFHPNMFPFVLFKWWFIPLGKLFGVISVSSIQELEQSLNPYLLFVEFTEYVLLVFRAFTYLFFSLMYINAVRIFRDVAPRLSRFQVSALGVLLFICCYTWPSVFDHFLVIRYECIGLALWAVALFFTISAAEQALGGKKLRAIFRGLFCWHRLLL